MPLGVPRGRVTPSDRLAEARGLVILASELQARGMVSPAGEMLWGALNHIITAITDHYQLQSGGRAMTKKQVTEHLQSIDPRDPPLATSLAVVGELHGHFYNKHMGDTRHSAAMSESFSFVQNLLNRPEVQAISPSANP